MDAFTLGWIADYPGVRNFAQLVDPDNTIYDAAGASPNGARLFWSEDSYTDPEVRSAMSEAFAQLSENPGNKDEAESARAEATLRLEKLLWESAALLPVYHSVEDVFWYDRVDYNPPGGMGVSRAKTSTSVQGLEGSDTLKGTSATFNALDPIASGNTASGSKVMDIFDAPLNYVNGTVEVEPLLIEDYTTNDDLTEYEFTLKQGVQFHGDYGELTADDMVYSIRRLVESSNSTNTYFPISVLNIDREEDEDGNVVPGSVAVEATGDTFSVTLRNSFGYALEVLSYSAFSAVPEGIVGDVEGYDGDMDYQQFSTNPVGCGPYVFEGGTPVSARVPSLGVHGLPRRRAGRREHPGRDPQRAERDIQPVPQRERGRQCDPDLAVRSRTERPDESGRRPTDRNVRSARERPDGQHVADADDRHVLHRVQHGERPQAGPTGDGVRDDGRRLHRERLQGSWRVRVPPHAATDLPRRR